MIVTLAVTGGFAPQLAAKRFALNSDQLSAEQAMELAKLVERVLSEGVPQVNPRVRDAQYYDLQISIEGQKNSISAADGSMTPGMSQLIKFLKNHGK